MAQKHEIGSPEDVSILSHGVKIEGNLSSEGNVRIDGTILGNVTVNGNLTIGESSEIRGEIKAKNITNSGKLEGTVNALNKLKLESKSVLKGDIICRVLVIEEGAFFFGNSKMNTDMVEKNNEKK